MRARQALILAAGLAAAFLIAVGELPAQTRTRAAFDVTRESYFPLQVGNHWVYARRGPAGMDGWKVAVSDFKKAPNSHRYFVLSGYFGEPARLVRRGLRDNVGEFNPRSNTDHLWYLLGAPVGTSWRMELEPVNDAGAPAGCVDGSRLAIVSRAEHVEVPAGAFANVVHVRFQPPCADAGILEEWFAPGVGLVRRLENSFAGPVVSELVRAEVGGRDLPRHPYSSTLAIDRPAYVNNLMPVGSPDTLPIVRGAFAVHNETPIPISFTFSGCKSISVVVRNTAGNEVLRASGNDGGCCECDNFFTFKLVEDVLVIPVAFRLMTPDGNPLPDGRYAVEVTLDTLETGGVHPSATAEIEVRSIH